MVYVKWGLEWVYGSYFCDIVVLLECDKENGILKVYLGGILGVDFLCGVVLVVVLGDLGGVN